MADDGAPKQPNGTVINPNDDFADDSEQARELTLLTILNRLIAAVFFPGPDSSAPLQQRVKAALSENVPLLRDASRNTGARVLEWTRRGSPLRALFAVSVSVRFFRALCCLRYFWICGWLFGVIESAIGTVFDGGISYIGRINVALSNCLSLIGILLL